MDPLTAIAFAGTVLSFVDFSWKLLTGTCDVYRSSKGMTEHNAQISNVINELRSVTEDLHEAPSGNNKHEKALRQLGSKCSELGDELMGLLKELKRGDKKNSLWSSFRVKLVSMRKASEVEYMVEQLDEYRSEIMLRLTLLLR